MEDDGWKGSGEAGEKRVVELGCSGGWGAMCWKLDRSEAMLVVGRKNGKEEFQLTRNLETSPV